VQAGKPRSKQNMTYQRRIKSKREFGIQVRIEQAIRNEAEKQRIRERPFNLKGRVLSFFSKKP
jgi:flagellar basal body-associated protein FliL